MKYASYFALALGLILMLAGTITTVRAQTPTSISLELSSSTVFVDETITFGGVLQDANTGDGVGGKDITLYREGMNPIPFLATGTDPDGEFAIDWDVKLERNVATPITVWAQFDGDTDAMPSRTSKTTFTIALRPLETVVTSDSNINRYFLGNKALFNVAFSDGMAHFVDPDFLRAVYDGNFVEMQRLDLGRYIFQTPYLVKFEQHQFGIFAEKWGFKSAQKSLTITVFGVQDYDPMRVTASKRGEEIRITVWNNILSPNNIYRFTGTLVGATPTESNTPGWDFTVTKGNREFIFRTTDGFVPPGKSVSFRMKADGSPTLLSWMAFDLHGQEHSSVRGIAGSGSTVVKPIPIR